MTTIFWLDLIFLFLGTVLSFSISLSVLGADPSRRINQLLSVYAFLFALWELFSLLVRILMKLAIGDWELFGRLLALAFFLMGPSLLTFASRYVGQRRWYWDAISFAGVVLCAAMVWPLFNDMVILNYYFNESGTTHFRTTILGSVLESVTIVYFVISIVLFWKERNRPGGKYLSLSQVILLAGLVAGGFVDFGFPIMAITMGASIALLGYAVLRVQLFNPLKERNAELQREITERKKIQAAFRASEADMKGLLAGIPDAIFSLRADGTVMGYSWPAGFEDVDMPEDLGGRKVQEVLREPAAAELSLCLEKAVTTGAPQMSEFSYMSGRKRRYYEIRVHKTGELRAIAIFRDVTRKKELEEKVLQSSKMEAIGRFAGGVAHDFNNILSVMLNFTDLSIREFPAETVRGYHDEIKKAILKASALPRQLLAFSKRQVLIPKIVNLNLVLSDMKGMIGRLLGEDIEFSMDLAPDLETVKADPVQIEQVVLNLAANSREALPHGGRISLRTRNEEVTADNLAGFGMEGLSPGRFVKLEFEDNGIGMDFETLAHAFEPFFTTKDDKIGIGLGLATVHGIVTQSSGFVTVASRQGVGTRFVILLPSATGAETGSPGVQAVGHGPRKGLTVLVVEDEDSIRLSLKRILESSGHRALLCSNAEEAMDLIDRGDHGIDVLLSDVIMKGGKNGVDLAAYVRSRSDSIKTILMSGYLDDILLKYGTVEPGTLFLQKPFDMSALLGKIDEAMS